MHWRTTTGLALLTLSFAAASAAERATIADAVEHRDQALVRTLIAAKADVNATQVDGTTALHWAAFNDDAETATLLVRSGANVNAVNRYGVPPLSLACANGNAAVVKLLLEAGADANAKLKGGETVLMVASRAGNVDAVQALLARGAKHDARERRGQTALMWAAGEGHAAVVQALVDAGADVAAALDSGFNAFFFAVREGHIAAAQALLDAGVDVNATLQRREPGRPDFATYKPPARGTSPLLMAVQNAHFELAIALVDRGADANDRRSGFTPLHTISWVRKPDSSDASEPAPIGSGRLTSLDFVREIVKRGANVNLHLPTGTPHVPNTSSRIDAEGATPLLFAADRSDVPLMRLLVELGADPLAANLTGTTPLMAAAGLGTTEPLEEAGEEPEAVEAVKMLLDLGADIDAVDDNGDTAMHGAAYGNYPLVVQLLADRGANPQVWKERNKFGRTPLFIAEGYHGRLPRPDPPTIAAVTRLMRAAGLSTEGERPAVVDIYEKPAAPQKPVKPQAPDAASPEPGFTSLFNGHDFSGWKIAGPAETFTVKDGAIVANGAASHAYYVGDVQGHRFRNFELKVDVMTRRGSNGGVYVLTEYQETGENLRASGRFPSKGFEIQVNNSHTDRIRTGSLYHVLDVLDDSPAKDDEWFTEHIIVSGDTITVNVNGKQVVRWTQPADWDGGREGPGRKITGPGTIALQGHDPNSTVYYKNIRIKPL